MPIYSLENEQQLVAILTTHLTDLGLQNSIQTKRLFIYPWYYGKSTIIFREADGMLRNLADKVTEQSDSLVIIYPMHEENRRKIIEENMLEYIKNKSTKDDEVAQRCTIVAACDLRQLPMEFFQWLGAPYPYQQSHCASLSQSMVSPKNRSCTIL